MTDNAILFAGLAVWVIGITVASGFVAMFVNNKKEQKADEVHKRQATDKADQRKEP